MFYHKSWTNWNQFEPLFFHSVSPAWFSVILSRCVFTRLWFIWPQVVGRLRERIGPRLVNKAIIRSRLSLCVWREGASERGRGGGSERGRVMGGEDTMGDIRYFDVCCLSLSQPISVMGELHTTHTHIHTLSTDTITPTSQSLFLKQHNLRVPAISYFTVEIFINVLRASLYTRVS